MGFDLFQSLQQFGNWAQDATADAVNTLTGNTFGTNAVGKLKLGAQQQRRWGEEAKIAADAVRAIGVEATFPGHAPPGVQGAAQLSAYITELNLVADGIVRPIVAGGVTDVSKVFDAFGGDQGVILDTLVEQLRTKRRWDDTHIAQVLAAIGAAIQQKGGPDTVTQSARASDGNAYLVRAAALIQHVTSTEAPPPGASGSSVGIAGADTVTLPVPGGAEGTPRPSSTPKGTGNFWWVAFGRKGKH